MVKGRKKLSIGIIYYKTYHDYEDRLLPNALRKKNIDVVCLPAEEQLDFERLKRRQKTAN